MEIQIRNRLVSQLGHDRVYPLKLPQTTDFDIGPAITYQKISNVETYSHSGNENLITARVQVSVYAKGYGQVKTEAKKIKKALDLYLTSTIKAIFVLNENDLYEDITKLYHIPIDFQVVYKEE